MEQIKTQIARNLQTIFLTDIIIGAHKDSIICSAYYEGALHIGPKEKKIHPIRNKSLTSFLEVESEESDKKTTTFTFTQGATIVVHYSASTFPETIYEETEYNNLRRTNIDFRN